MADEDAMMHTLESKEKTKVKELCKLKENTESGVL